MVGKPKYKFGKKYYPKRKGVETRENEVIGTYWKAWSEGKRYFLEYDAGHFVTEFVTAEISHEDYMSLRRGKMSPVDMISKYGDSKE